MAAHSSYREFRPREALADLVECTWERTSVSDSSGRVLPDGCVDLVWDGNGRLFVAGPDTGAVASERRAGSVVVGLRLRPGVAGSALAHPADELRDARVPLEALWNGEASLLAERLAEAEDGRGKRSILEEALLVRRAEIEVPEALVRGAIPQLGRPNSRVSSLSETVFLSERHLRRAFHQAVGYGPKTLDRVLRFRRFLARRPENLARAAVELGYADQAHLTRECVRLSGLTPRRLLVASP